MHHRRMFLQTGAAALALPAVGGFLVNRQRSVVEAACASCADDPVSAEAMRQFKAAIRGLAKSGKGEHARQAAAALRVLAVNSRVRNLDATFRRQVQHEVKTYGRDNVLLRPFNREQFAATARDIGFAAAPDLRILTLAERRQALAALVSEGPTAHMERGADLFEAAGAQLDARGPVQRVQTKEQMIAMCRDLQTLLTSAETAMIVGCIFSGPVTCAFLSGYYLGVKLYYETQTECSRWVG